MTRPSWAPSGVGINKPSVACVCDYNLGRSHNFTADREFADEVTAAVPDALWVVHENRAFLHRAVRFLLSHDEVVALFTGETLVEPGVVQIPHRRPDQPDEFGADVACYPGYAGVAGID